MATKRHPLLFDVKYFEVNFKSTSLKSLQSPQRYVKQHLNLRLNIESLKGSVTCYVKNVSKSHRPLNQRQFN